MHHWLRGMVAPKGRPKKYMFSYPITFIRFCPHVACALSQLRTFALSIIHCSIVIIGVGSAGQPGHAPPIIKMGGKTPFLPPNNHENLLFLYLKKRNMKESRRNRDKERKIQRKGSEFCTFLEKVVDDLNKRSAEIF